MNGWNFTMFFFKSISNSYFLLTGVQEKLGILNNGVVYAVFDYDAHNSDELTFHEGDKMVVLRKGDEWEREWWWSRLNDQEGYIPRNLLGVSFSSKDQNLQEVLIIFCTPFSVYFFIKI